MNISIKFYYIGSLYSFMLADGMSETIIVQRVQLPVHLSTQQNHNQRVDIPNGL